MRITFNAEFIFFWVILFCVNSLGAENQYSSQLLLRTGFGSFANTGTQAGSSGGTGGFNLQYISYLNSRLAYGFGYQAQFDLNTKSIPISGLEIIGRIHFWNQGTVVTTKSAWGELETHAQYAPYFGMLYGKRQFFLGPDKESSDTTKQLAGEHSVINAGLGLDYRLSRNFELNAEYLTSVLTFTTTDPRVKIGESVLWLGLGYIF